MLTTGALASGAGAAGLVAIVMALAAVFRLRPTSSALVRLAGIFGKWAGLDVPPEVAGRIGARVRRRTVAAFVIGFPIFTAMMFLLGDGFWDQVNDSLEYRPVYLAVAVGPVLVAWALSAVVNLRLRQLEIRQARLDGTLIAGDQSLGRTALIPAAAAWVMGAMMAMPVVALAAIWIGVAGYHPSAWRLAGLSLNVLVAFGCLGYARAAQLSLARGARIGATAAERALDQALAAKTAFDLAQLPVAAAFAGTIAGCWPVFAGGDRLLEFVPTVPTLLLLVVLNALNLPWSTWRRAVPPACGGVVPEAPA